MLYSASRRGTVRVMRISRHRADRLILRLGVSLLMTGYLIFSFVGYTLWGTGLAEKRAQHSLEAQFAEVLATVPAFELPAPSEEGGTTVVDPREISYVTGNTASVSSGAPIASLWIPKISVEKTVVHGTRFSHLKTGPGHFEHSAMFGHTGNAAIAGHRTTYGAPFERLDELTIDDRVWVRTVEGQFEYRVMEKRVVRPTEVSVVARTADPLLTLVTCHPKYSASTRLIVRAELVGEPVESRIGGDLDEGQPAAAPGSRTTASSITASTTSTTSTTVLEERVGDEPSVTQPSLSDAEWGGWNQDIGAWWLVAVWGSLMLAAWRFAYLAWRCGGAWRVATVLLVTTGCGAQWLWCAAMTGIAPNSL